MKRTLLLISILLLALSFIFSTENDQHYGQTVHAFIDDTVLLLVSQPSYASAATGINLNYADETSSYRYLITPTANPMSEPGLPLCTFDLFATYTQSSGGRLLITHSPMTLSTNAAITLDWELAVVYSVSDGSTTTGPWTRYCLSSGSVISSEILITLPASGLCSIEGAELFFRFAEGVFPSVGGDYYSDISFTLEAL